MTEEVKTVEVPEETTPETVKPEIITREQMREKGWTAKELDSAEKRGMIQGEETKKKEEATKAPTVTPPTPEETAKAEMEKKAAEMTEAAKRGGVLPDFTMTPSQEKVFLETFGAGTAPRAMYFRMKNERQARQRAEAERDRMALELQVRKDEEARRSKPEEEQTVDAEGNPIDPEDKPLTMKQLRALQKAEQDEHNRKQQELNARSTKVADALKEQEEYAKATLPDFEDTVRLATDLVNNLDKIEDPLRKSKVVKMLVNLQKTAGTADQYGVEDETASMIAYELGQMHPEYGKKSETNGAAKKADPKANGGLTPEQMKRIEENTQRRASSASLPGSSGGKRTISVGDVTVKELLRMTPEGRFKFKKDNPERYSELMRG